MLVLLQLRTVLQLRLLQQLQVLLMQLQQHSCGVFCGPSAPGNHLS
jgi:hypothetical protein